VSEPEAESTGSQDALEALARLQHFDGSFELNETFAKVLGFALIDAARASLSNILSTAEAQNNSIVAAVLAIQFMHVKLVSSKDSWESLSEKAAEWLEGALGSVRAKEVILAVST
jgi:hypothetical protein